MMTRQDASVRQCKGLVIMSGYGNRWWFDPESALSFERVVMGSHFTLKHPGWFRIRCPVTRTRVTYFNKEGHFQYPDDFRLWLLGGSTANRQLWQISRSKHKTWMMLKATFRGGRRTQNRPAVPSEKGWIDRL